MAPPGLVCGGRSGPCMSCSTFAYAFDPNSGGLRELDLPWLLRGTRLENEADAPVDVLSAYKALVYAATV